MKVEGEDICYPKRISSRLIESACLTTDPVTSGHDMAGGSVHTWIRCNHLPYAHITTVYGSGRCATMKFVIEV